MDFYNQLQEVSDWQEITLVHRDGLGSFNKIKIKLEHPWLFKNSAGDVWLHQNEDLPTANGYFSLDGREFLILQKFGKKLETIATFHVEDCGLGSAKAKCACDYFGYHFKGNVINL